MRLRLKALLECRVVADEGVDLLGNLRSPRIEMVVLPDAPGFRFAAFAGGRVGIPEIVEALAVVTLDMPISSKGFLPRFFFVPVFGLKIRIPFLKIRIRIFKT